jgi:hypothetical protein
MRNGVLMLLGCLLCGCDRPVAPAKKDAPKPADSPAPASGGGGGVNPANTNYQSGGGAVQNIRQAARRTVALADMDQLGKFITQQETELGKMPSIADIKTYIKRDAPKILAAIDEGTIILTGSTNRSGLWAYEVDADKAGGIVLVAGTARRATADEAKQLLASN